MRQVWITSHGDPSVLEVREAPDPSPGPGEVLIEVAAAGVNFADLMCRRGKYVEAPKPPYVPGLEVGGRVAGVGEGVTQFREGDEVLAATLFGGYTTHAVVPEKQVFRRPEGMAAATGAAIPINYLAAFQAMVVMGSVRHAHELGGIRMRVLVHSAAGGVGTAASDIGRMYGVELFGTAAPEKHDFLRQRGYDHALSSRDGRWQQEAQELVGDRGFDLILDPLGGDHWARSLRLLAPTGRLCIYGYSDALKTSKLALAAEAFRIPWRSFSPLTLMQRNRGVLGIHVGRLWRVEDDVRAWARKLITYYERGEVRPHVGRTFPLEEAAAAHEFIEARENRGKVVLTCEV